MLKLVSYIKELADKERRKLIVPICFSVIDSLLNSCMYGVMLFLLLDLVRVQLTKERVWIYTGVMAIVFVFRCIAQAIGFTVAQCTGSEVTYQLRLRIANHLRSLNLGYFNKNSIGKLTGVLITDVNDFNTILTHCLCDFIKVTSFTMMSLLTCIWINMKLGFLLTIVVCIAVPLLIFSGNISANNAKELSSARQNATSRIVEYVSGMKTFRLYNLTGERFQRLDGALQKMRRESIKAEISLLPITLGVSTITAFVLPVALIGGTYLLAKEEIDIVRFLVAILLAVSISGMLGVLASLYPQMQAVLKSSENILSVLKEKPLTYEKEKVSFQNFDIEFSNVSFQYTQKVPILQNISFQAKKGTTTALIGPSGSGKTTIISLLARFWDVSKGTITIGGENIREISPDIITKYISVVFQDVYLLQDTILNNIRVGKPDATIQEVIQAAKAANCHDFIQKMELGYETVIGEGGSTLSGGEKQRIAIARALLKDAPIVLLDETTSNLDADNEYEIQAAFERLMKDKTVLVIAHKLETIANADKIIVLQNGCIQEEGKHNELLIRKGWYAAMHEERCKAREWKL